MSDRPSDPGLTSGDPLAPGPDEPRHESGLPGVRARRAAGGAGYASPPPPGALGGAVARGPAGRVGQYQLAGWWSRVGAALIDGLIIGVGALIILAIFGSVFSVGFFASDETGVVVAGRRADARVPRDRDRRAALRAADDGPDERQDARADGARHPRRARERRSR